MSAINTDEEKSFKHRAEARGNSAPLPHMAHSPRILSGTSRVPGHWEAKSIVVPGRHTAGWANGPGLDIIMYIMASRMVKSPDSHAREPRSLLGGSS